VCEATTHLDRVRIVEAFLLSRLQFSVARPRFEAAIRQIVTSCGQTRVDQLADTIGWSPRQLEREFRNKAGRLTSDDALHARIEGTLKGQAASEEWTWRRK
jgi:transcriptional regulator GlxA family with amidase domain